MGLDYQDNHELLSLWAELPRTVRLTLRRKTTS